MGLMDDYKIKQLQGLGQLGAEIAITRGVVATAAFKFNGILSSSTTSIKNTSILEAELTKGAQKARKINQPVLKKVREKLGF